ncbi:MAG: Asp-tRNA(Asn)/Glu-tRNA(Gln) amidotransferase subunit GatB [Alphaproteobacteria bacterium]|jgi:aspartyl-tRNA(Asn)/glutamyl-tRNA(Gln) amidotransferase subunit B
MAELLETPTRLKGETGEWEMVIGLEVHAQVTSQSKLFSGAPVAFGAEPNTQVSLVDAAFPGMLPVLNETCIERAVLTGLGINGTVNKYSRFDRKNYFYADLPQGYQISQFEFPIVTGGFLDVEPEGEVAKRIGVTRLHVEQDAGKSMHDQHPTQSYIDLNRSGTALMEIVSEPDMRSAEQATAYITKMRQILRYLGTCDGNMDQGSMRCDINVSVRKPGDELGTRCEVKNVNSIRFVRQAIEYEAKRQIKLIESGGEVVQETRLYDSTKGETRSMRSKEDAHDYRYFPDPDLLPLVLQDGMIERIAATMPELPDAKRARFVSEYGIPDYDAWVMTSDQVNADFFESVAKGRDAKLAVNWITGDYFAYLNREGFDVTNAPIGVNELGGLIDLISDDTISGRIAKEVFEGMITSGKDAATVVEENGLRQITDTGAIEGMIDDVIAKNGDKVEQYRGGKDKLFGFFVGQVMKATQGKANPAAVNDLLRQKLDG